MLADISSINFYVSLGDKTEAVWSFLRLKVPGSNWTLILSLSLSRSLSLSSVFSLSLFLSRSLLSLSPSLPLSSVKCVCCFYYHCDGHCWWKSWSVITSSVIGHSHTWNKNVPFYGCQRLSVSACLSHPRIKLLSQTVHHCYMSRLMTKPTKWHVRPAKTQVSLGIRPVWSESSLSAKL